MCVTVMLQPAFHSTLRNQRSTELAQAQHRLLRGFCIQLLSFCPGLGEAGCTRVGVDIQSDCQRALAKSGWQFKKVYGFSAMPVLPTHKIYSAAAAPAADFDVESGTQETSTSHAPPNKQPQRKQEELAFVPEPTIMTHKLLVSCCMGTSPCAHGGMHAWRHACTAACGALLTESRGRRAARVHTLQVQFAWLAPTLTTVTGRHASPLA